MVGESALRQMVRVPSSKVLRANPDEFYKLLIKAVAEVCGTEMNSIYLTDPSGKTLHLKAEFGLPSDVVDAIREIPVGTLPQSAVCGRAAALKRPVFASDLDAPWWGPYREYAEVAGIRAVWSFPLISSEGELLGTMATYFRTEKVPSEEELVAVERITCEAAYIIEMSRLFQRQEEAIQLNRQAQRLAQRLVLRDRPEEVFATMTEALQRLLRVDVVWLEYMPQIGEGKFFQYPVIFNESPIRWRESPFREALEAGRPVYKVNYSFSGTVSGREPMHFAALLCYPVQLEDGHVVISAGWRMPHPVSEREYEVLDLYANFGGIALQNAARYDALRSSYYGMMRGLLISLEVRDFETIAHSRRVVTYTMLLADALGLPSHHYEELALGAALHDVGKIGLPDTILGKPGPLTPDEYELVKQHPVIGYQMLEECLPHFPVALDMVRHHHERFDGTGYPDGLAGDAISLEASILAVADAFDVMTMGRPYRPARSVVEARQELAVERGRQFHPDCVDKFLALDVDLITAVREGRLDRSPFGPNW